jgi:amino acid transporter
MTTAPLHQLESERKPRRPNAIHYAVAIAIGASIACAVLAWLHAVGGLTPEGGGPTFALMGFGFAITALALAQLGNQVD